MFYVVFGGLNGYIHSRQLKRKQQKTHLLDKASEFLCGHNRLNEEAITKLGYFECSVLMEMNIIQFNNFSQKGQGRIYHRGMFNIVLHVH